MSVAPFPFGSLEALTRAEIAAAKRVRRAVTAHVDIVALSNALSEFAKERVEVLVRRYRRADGSKSTPDAVGFVLESDTRRILVEVEAALATSLAARVLQRPPPRLVDATHPASPVLSGAVAAIALAVVRRAHVGSAFRVVAAGPAMAVAREHFARYASSTTAWLTVIIGADAFDARVSVDDAPSAPSAPPRPFDPAALGPAPIVIPILGTTCLASRSEIAALAPGDAFCVAGLTLPSAGSTAALVPERGEFGLAVEVADACRLVVRGHVESFPWEAAMNERAIAETTARVLDDASVVVRVELGAVEMKAHEWASLAAGDVITLGRKLGELAILRVGGVEVARGELVQVEGEYGVRIVSRTEDR